jgi:hypothetical protein
MYYHLTQHTDDDRNAMKDGAKTIKTPADIITNDDGEPEIPSICVNDGYDCKAIQKTVRQFCIHHLRESYPYFVPHHS